LRGEVLATLEMLKAMGTTLVLGLRDIMDDPNLLIREWERRQVLPALEHLYDEIRVYGLESFAGPLAGVNCPPAVRRKIVYTGYLKRTVPLLSGKPPIPVGGQPYLLVTVGGGDDGMSVVDWVLSAYEHDPEIPLAAAGALAAVRPAAARAR